VPLRQKSTGSYADVVYSATQPRNEVEADENNQHSAYSGLIFVTGKHKNERALHKITNSVNVDSEKPRIHVTEIRSTATLSYITKKATRLSLFALGFSPKVASQDIQKSLEERLKTFSNLYLA
jgi:hypothetical protein